jgi:hypothetical protein
MTQPAMNGVRLDPYDQGYRDGWHDIHITRHPRRRRRRQRSDEYALGYGHGRTDGDRHPDYPDWWPDFARAAVHSLHVPRPSTAHTGRKATEATKDRTAA